MGNFFPKSETFICPTIGLTVSELRVFNVNKKHFVSSTWISSLILKNKRNNWCRNILNENVTLFCICLQTGTLCELYDTTNCEPCDKCLELQRLKSNFETFLDPSCQKCITSVHYISNYADVLNRNTPYTCKKVLTTDVSESAGGQDNFSDNLWKQVMFLIKGLFCHTLW